MSLLADDRGGEREKAVVVKVEVVIVAAAIAVVVVARLCTKPYQSNWSRQSGKCC